MTPYRQWQADEVRFDPSVFLTMMLGIAAATFLAVAF